MEAKKSMKTLWYILTAFIAAVVAVAALSLSASAETSGDYEYKVFSAGAATIIDYTGEATEITIPSEIDGYKVTSIGSFAFYNCSSLTIITIPNSVTSIGGWAFASCEGLTNITIPDSVTSIGERIFAYCKSLTGITIGDSVTSIGNYAFDGCTSLTSITIPDSVTSIGNGVFEGCNSLTSINVESGNTEYISENGILFTKNKDMIIAYPVSKTEKSYTIPDSVTSIGEWAFSGCEGLTNITIPDSVTGIGKFAFFNCEGLTNITIPNSVTSIGEMTFSGCEGLTNITIPDSVTSIGDSAFSNCYSLTDVYYTGTEEEWNKISVTVDNESLLNATFHYNYKPYDPLEAFVSRLYTILLDRSADPDGLANWINRLKTGTATSAEIVYGMAASAEFNNKGLSNEDIVERLYQAMLDRASDAAGKADWVSKLNAGMSVNAIINGFSGSTEFSNICAEYSIKAGSISNLEPRDNNFGLTSFVSRMYTKALGRPYDVDGLNDWTNRYLTGTAKVGDIAYGFIFSQEFMNKNLDDSTYLDTLYRTFFDREPDEGGKADWLEQLSSGTSREDVLNGFVGSQECINLVNSFNI